MILKLYKWLYRLLRLKHYQRVEIETRCMRWYTRVLSQYKMSCNEMNIRLADYERVLQQHGIRNPYELFLLLESMEFVDGATNVVALKNRLRTLYTGVYFASADRFYTPTKEG